MGIRYASILSRLKPFRQTPTPSIDRRQPPRSCSEGLAAARKLRQLGAMNADRSPHRTDLSDAARVREVAGLLALAVNRLMQRKSTVLSPTLAEKELDGSGIPSMSPTLPSSTREAA
jgi:hypothetical protein